MRMCFKEACTTEHAGSAGAQWIALRLQQYGDIVILPFDATDDGYDVEFISIHHQRDYGNLPKIRKSAPVRVIGGHVTYTNPRPIIPYADYVCVGDGEDWIQAFFYDRPSATIDCARWQYGDPLPDRHLAASIDDNPAVYSAESGKKHWSIEISRGCQYACAYCEIGRIPYRFKSVERIQQQLDAIPTTSSRWLRLISPEEGSHPHYLDILDLVRQHRMQLASVGFRIEQMMRYHLPLAKNTVLRVGIDGLTESRRFAIKKPIPDRLIVEFFKKYTQEGFVNFKLYLMFGYEGETPAEFSEFEKLMNAVFRLTPKTPVMINVTWTPLIPMAGTALASTTPNYNDELVQRIQRWHVLHRQSKNNLWHVSMSRLPSKAQYLDNVRLALGDERLLYSVSEPLHAI